MRDESGIMLITIPLILKRRRYFVSVLLTATVTFILSYILTVWNITGKSLSAYAAMSGWPFTLFSLFLSLIISVLAGVYSSLFLARRRIIKSKEISTKGGLASGGKNKLSGVSGMAAGLFAAGCPTCGAPLFALFGAPLALFSLPFHGLELKALSVTLLLLSVNLLVENIKKQLVCQPKSI
ncbi:MAG: hypothetical protein HY569_02295 [Candidatus Magasanikbacteria bacterium]|nr:hypothetical protein [Candidatus Magasanikbacteria bacterium]